MTIVIDIRKGCGHADSIRESYPSGRRNILELAGAEISPKLISAELIDKIEVQLPIAIHIRDGHPGTMIVVGRFPILGGIIDRLMAEGYSAPFPFVLE
jgi:hypothetical protein